MGPANDALVVALDGAMSVAIAAAHVLYHELGGVAAHDARRVLLEAAPILTETAGNPAGDRKAAQLFATHAGTQSAARAFMLLGRQLVAAQCLTCRIVAPADALRARLIIHDPSTMQAPATHRLAMIALENVRAAMMAFAKGELPDVGIGAMRAAIAMSGIEDALALLNQSHAFYQRVVLA